MAEIIPEVESIIAALDDVDGFAEFELGSIVRQSFYDYTDADGEGPFEQLHTKALQVKYIASLVETWLIMPLKQLQVVRSNFLEMPFEMRPDPADFMRMDGFDAGLCRPENIEEAIRQAEQLRTLISGLDLGPEPGPGSGTPDAGGPPPPRPSSGPIETARLLQEAKVTHSITLPSPLDGWMPYEWEVSIREKQVLTQEVTYEESQDDANSSGLGMKF